MQSAVQTQVFILLEVILLSEIPWRLAPLRLNDHLNVFVQMSAVETTFDEVVDIFETGGAKGLSGDSVDKLPKIEITRKNNVDTSGEKICCSVCLQVGYCPKILLKIVPQLTESLRYNR